jgi:hypothetical protein
MVDRSLYMRAMHAMMVKAQAAAKERASPKLRSVAVMEPMRMENSSQERKVRSVASWTLGSTREGTQFVEMRHEGDRQENECPI